MSTEICTLAGGCFWCLDSAFRQVKGITKVASGYIGGQVVNPGYRQVCTGMTGHAEAVQLAFNADQISYRDILDIFFSLHDPTTLNRQGADVGSQYRSAIFIHSEQQKQMAEEVIASLNDRDIWDAPIVTTLEPLSEFYPAEEYHQDYYSKDSQSGYCQMVISPKLAKFRDKYRARLK